MLNSAFFSTACWGVASQQIAIGFSYFALALVVSNTPETPALTRWVRWVLAGLASASNVMQGADIGAIFSVFIAAFVLFKTLVDESGSIPVKVARSVGRRGGHRRVCRFHRAPNRCVACRHFHHRHCRHRAGRGKPRRRNGTGLRNGASPKLKRCRFVRARIVRLQDGHAEQHGNVSGRLWRRNLLGRGGARPGDWMNILPLARKARTPPHGFIRQTGGGGYAGILVGLLAGWAIAQSLRRQNSVVWRNPAADDLVLARGAGHLAAAVIGAGLRRLLRRSLYELPYASLIRNPTKFLLVFSWAIVVLFAYGVHGLSRRYLEVPAANFKSSITQLQAGGKTSAVSTAIGPGPASSPSPPACWPG